MEPLVLALVLTAAVFHATWNAMVKSAGDRLTSMAVMMGMSAVIAFPLLFLVPLPDPGAWPHILISVAIHNVYYLALVMSYQTGGDLSQVYPIARGSSPLYVVIISTVFVGELLSPGEMLGVAIISGGILSLALIGGISNIRPKPLFFAVIVGLLISCYTLVDGLGARSTVNPISYIAWMFLLEGIPICFITIYRRRGILRENLLIVWPTAVIGGTLGTLGYGVVMWAMANAPIAHVAALRETSVIFAAFIGTYLLGEPGGRWRVLAAISVVVGIILLQISAP